VQPRPAVFSARRQEYERMRFAISFVDDAARTEEAYVMWI
jgi:hypothetical protein